ncbi:MAG: hypothetical protein AAGI89_15195 [Pseudomonadota bacterium]
MHRRPSAKEQRSSSGMSDGVFVFDVSADAIARRAEQADIAVPEQAAEGVRTQLRALRAHAEAAGLPLGGERG